MTTDALAGGRRLRCALFVDFDNVYLGLRRLDAAAAETFARAPAEWLTALERGSDADGEFSRRFLVRACYLNPSAFSAFRPNFTRAGFSVVDCPSLTQQGKSSADINLVLDAVDALGSETRYDEFVIMSGDADFTPLALRFRAADRRVTVITAGPAAGAYRAVADTVITADELAELVRPQAAEEPSSQERPAAAGEPPRPRAAGQSPPDSRATGGSPPSPARLALLRLVRSANRPVVAGSAAQAASAADPTLVSSNWDGAGTFFAWITRSVPEVGVASRPSPGWVYDSKRFSEGDLQGPGGGDVSTVQRQVVAVTETPNLPRESYRFLITALAEDFRAHTFDRPETAKRVRDACQAAGFKVGRASVNTVVTGILLAGLDPAAAPTAAALARTWADNVVGLCRGARIELQPRDVAAIRSWVGGGLLDE